MDSVNILSGTQAIVVSELFLPGTNISVTSYIDGEVRDSLNSSVISINTTHWYSQSDYFFYPSTTLSPLFSYIDRVSNNGTFTHNATDYLDWQANPSSDFEFWIDTTDLVSNTNYTVTETTHILDNIGEFDAWRINGSISSIPFTIWYEKHSGLFLSFYQFFVSSIWYNLTSLDLPELPQDYVGPTILNSSPVNESMKTSGTQIEISFESLYGIQYLFYHWDGDTTSNLNNSNKLITIFPETDGMHILFVDLTGNLGFDTSYQFKFYTNNSLLGVNLLNLNNNSKINGNTQIELEIFSGNGTLIYFWDTDANSTIPEGAKISVLNPSNERVAVLTVFVKGDNTTEWVTRKFTFIIDNTPPKLSITNTNNGTTTKGTVKIDFTANEPSNLFYNLNGGTNVNIFLEDNQTQSVFFSELPNGSHILNTYLIDEANNSEQLLFVFSIYISSFNWDWELKANTPKKIPFLDASGDLLFSLTITSKIDQNFSMSRDFDNSTLELTDNIEYLFKFMPDSPEDIIFLELFLPLKSLTDNILDIYEWHYWDQGQEEWIFISTNYNDIEFGWEATLTESNAFFVLIKTGETTTITYSDPGGGLFAPSFGIDIVLFAFFMFFISKRFMFKKNKKLR
jgi:hypothetical protein